MIIELRNPVKKYEILDYEKIIGDELHIKERDPDVYGDCIDLKYYADFPNYDLVENNFLRGVFGDGQNPNDAIIDYCKKISNRVLKNPSKQIVIEVPQLVHTRYDEVSKLCENYKN